MFSPVASGIFTFRNIDKTANGDIGRGAVAYGQAAGVLQEAAKSTGVVGNAARSTVSVFSKMAKQHKAFEYAGKITKFAVDHVNPLICVAGAYKTLKSDDKIKTGITEACALGTMFAGEALVKQNYDLIVKSNTCQNILKKASDTKLLKPVFDYLKKNNLSGKAGSIIKGITFVLASIGCYTIGQKMGENLSDNVKANFGIKNKPVPQKINQRA